MLLLKHPRPAPSCTSRYDSINQHFNTFDLVANCIMRNCTLLGTFCVTLGLINPQNPVCLCILHNSWAISIVYSFLFFSTWGTMTVLLQILDDLLLITHLITTFEDKSGDDGSFWVRVGSTLDVVLRLNWSTPQPVPYIQLPIFSRGLSCNANLCICFLPQVIKEAIKDSVVYRKETPSRCSVSLSLNEIQNKKFLKRDTRATTRKWRPGGDGSDLAWPLMTSRDLFQTEQRRRVGVWGGFSGHLQVVSRL